MLTRLLVVLMLTSPALAFAACVSSSGAVSSSVLTCDSGTETAAPSAATDGLSLDAAFFGRITTGVAVFAEAAGAMTAGGKLEAWLLNPVTSAWQRAPDLDLTVTAVAKQGFLGLKVVASKGRLAYKPNGTGVATTVYLVPSFQ